MTGILRAVGATAAWSFWAAWSWLCMKKADRHQRLYTKWWHRGFKANERSGR